ncbi:hypothetical protein Avbf_11056 [Armadillidium vulgare]|nr:hypothetical protein Avbf_11056 [Armadillidium vulgare]
MSIKNSFVNDIFERIAAKPLVWLITTRDQPSPPGKFKQLSGSCFLENWQNTLSQREPKLLPNIPHPTNRKISKYRI